MAKPWLPVFDRYAAALGIAVPAEVRRLLAARAFQVTAILVPPMRPAQALELPGIGRLPVPHTRVLCLVGRQGPTETYIVLDQQREPLVYRRLDPQPQRRQLCQGTGCRHRARTVFAQRAYCPRCLKQRLQTALRASLIRSAGHRPGAAARP